MGPETGEGRVFPDFTYGAQAVELAVDTETGEITVLKSVGAHDVGRAINAAAVDGQVEGGILMGQGYALTEDMLMVEGKVVTPSLSEYLIPTPEDMPEIKSIILESRSGVGPFGAKGIGEPSFAPIAPAISNAVTDAIGVRIFELPITAERVVIALKQAKAG
jgi:CO/xanthine dehydrogenase Mo-binding subunit